jgi:CBS domain-containing protein
MRENALAAHVNARELTDKLAQVREPWELAALLCDIRAFVVGRAGGGDVLETGRAAAALYDALLVRAAALARGGPVAPPPGACLMALGSQGRCEQFLATDQDNALVLQDRADEGQRQAYAAFAGRMRDILEAAGMPPCPRGIMAAASEWRRTAREWRDALDGAADRPDAAGVLLVSLLADARAVDGDAALAGAVAAHVRRRAADAPLLVRGLAREALHFAPEAHLPGPFSLSGRHAPVDLKRAAVYPLVLGVKALALEAGVPETGTMARIGALSRLGRIGEDSAARLTRAFACVQALRLRRQAQAAAAGGQPDNRLDPASLTPPDREELRRVFRAVADFTTMLEHHFGLAYLT